MVEMSVTQIQWMKTGTYTEKIISNYQFPPTYIFAHRHHLDFHSKNTSPGYIN